jgi:hypothetical protein
MELLFQKNLFRAGDVTAGVTARRHLSSSGVNLRPGDLVPPPATRRSRFRNF